MTEDHTDTDPSSGWYLSQMARARGLLAAIERVKNQGTPSSR